MRTFHLIRTTLVVISVMVLSQASLTATPAGQQSAWPTTPTTTTPTPKKPAADAKPASPSTKAEASAKSETPAKTDASATADSKPAASAPTTAPAVATDAEPSHAADRDRELDNVEHVVEEQQRAIAAQQELIDSLVKRLTALAQPTPASTPADKTPTSVAAAPATTPVTSTPTPVVTPVPAAPAPVVSSPKSPSADPAAWPKAPVATTPPAPHAPQVKTAEAAVAKTTAVQTPVAATATPDVPTVTIGGFIDATSAIRSTNVGSGLGTSFGSIPFSNTAAGSLSEARLSAQNSRLTFGVNTRVGTTAVKGYLEADFLGQGPTNQFVTSNAATLRMRLAWIQATSGSVEFLAGQSWSFLTPNRNGLSPVPSDIFFSQNVDTNYQAGLTWGRTNQFRVVFHPTKTVAAGVSFENPQQYVGSAGTLPAAFTAAEVDNGSNTATPNLYPDIIAKLALDPKTGATHQHVEVGALVRGFKTYDPTANASYAATGIAYSAAANVEPVKNLHVVASGFFGNGGGRYIANTNIPDFIVTTDSHPSLVKARSVIVGVEDAITPRFSLSSYYSNVHADPNTAVDTNGKAIGFGITGAASANQSITETTFGVTRVFFKDPARGTLQLMTQYSFVERTPFSVAAGSPASASGHMVWINVRYVLPNASIGTSSAPTATPQAPAPAAKPATAKTPEAQPDPTSIPEAGVAAKAAEEATPEMSPDRPGFGEGADVVGAGLVELESGVTYGGSDGVRSLTVPNGLLRFGLTSRIEARVAADGFLSERDGDLSRSGYSDFQASLKVRLLDQRGAGLDVAIIPVVSLPTGAPGFSSGGVDPTVKIALGRTLPAGLSLSGNVLAGSVSGSAGRSITRAASLSIGHDLAAGWAAFFETYGVTAGTPNTPTTISIDWGATRDLSSNLRFDVEAGRSLDTSDWFVGFGISARGRLTNRR